jgi:dihydropteroate synthase
MADPTASGALKLQVRDKVLDLSTPKVMGILNTTPDSFSDGGKFISIEPAIAQIGLMVSQGASIIDVGGESTSPGSDPVSEPKELARVLPVLEKAIPEFSDTLFSIDTTKYTVAEKALQLGAHIVNDISGLQREPALTQLCAAANAGYILMHSRGNPKTMQDHPVYEDVIEDINSFFEKKIARTKQAGIQSIIIDPGIGFGKTQEHDIRILKNLDSFCDLEIPLMIGASRKRVIGKILNGRPIDERLTGTVLVHYHAMLKGARIIRTHDVKQAADSILVYNALIDH